MRKKSMNKYIEDIYKTNIDISFEDFLNKLNLTEDEYITTIRFSLTKRTMVLKRSSLAVGINNYNRKLLKYTESNIDIQGVFDAYATATYMLSYILKIDEGLNKLLQNAEKDIQLGNNSIQNSLKRVANTFVNASSVCAQEAAYLVNSMTLAGNSRDTIYLNTVPIKERTKVLKSKKQLAELPPDSEDIFFNNIFDHYASKISRIGQCLLGRFRHQLSAGDNL